MCALSPMTSLAQDGPFLPGSALPSSSESNPAEPPPLPPGEPGGQLGLGDEEFSFEKTTDELEEETRRQAFDAALQGLLPLRPEEIRRLLERFDRTQESVNLPVYPPPKPEIAVETLSMDPGSVPKTIKLAYGYVTTFNVVDSTGAPWPIQNITWAGNFNIVQTSQDGNDTSGNNSDQADDDGYVQYQNILRITPEAEYAYGNMSMTLVGLRTPIIISLETARDLVHYRYDAIIPEKGPLAKTPLIDSAGGAGGLDLVAGNADMSGILEGVAPPSAIKMAVSGADGRTSAYRFGGLTYLRTPLTLLSPSWISSASSADGMQVYAMSHSPVVLLSDKGKTVRVRISDREDIFDEQ